MNWEDVLIVGDSFCGNRTDKNHWPQYLTSKITGIAFNPTRVPRGQGYPGASWWSVRNRLIKELAIRIPKVLIICHTEPLRIPNDNDWGVNFRSVELGQIHVLNSTDKPMPTNFKLGASLYYQEIMSLNFHEWANLAWFKELNEIAKPIEKVLHLYCFEGQYTDYTFSKGTTLTVPLITYQREAPIFRKAAFAPNHFTLQDNIIFAESLARLVDNYPGDNIRIDAKII